MGSTILRREVLLPRKVEARARRLRSEHDGESDLVDALEMRTRAAIRQALWASVALAGFANVAAHMLGTWL